MRHNLKWNILFNDYFIQGLQLSFPAAGGGGAPPAFDFGLELITAGGTDKILITGTLDRIITKVPI